MKNHTFVVCAYKENPYLERAIQSLMNQTIQSNIIISTSTLNSYINNLAQKYNLKIFINDGKGDQADNFNFAYSCAKTRFVTLCHQDDYYHANYLENILKSLKGRNRALIAFCNYFEVHNNKVISDNKVLKIKRYLLSPFQIRFICSNRFVRRRILGFGNPICCPSITYNKEKLAKLNFSSDYKGTLDYEMLERISKMKGEFIYCNKKLVYHQISDGTDTRRTINNGYRSMEGKKILERLWSICIAKIIANQYKKAQSYYK